ncbi:tryptophan halogenase [Sphingorhabdus lutea]|uniref:Tryptophan halogenase n=1 Tax=Sphingorhabdus lutea TaxID=1913578 RepID=A0A1L3JEQ1_9SPHN|nr:tryptophan halogenase family protein [Sphingorhabdus lutea]APG63610.1 tryptophan halogenase [Sphingorhabdus lutea]
MIKNDSSFIGSAIKDIVIVGGGTAGWMAAAAFSRFLDNGNRNITLVESEEIGTVGVGEATIPAIINFNKMLEISENDFLRATQGTFKLGIEFVNWGQVGDSYFHPFGNYGQDLHGINFHQLYLREHALGDKRSISQYCMSAMAAQNGRFGRASANARSPVSEIFYAYHFDASLYAKMLREYAENNKVNRQEGRVVDVVRHAENGFVESVILDDGRKISGDLFIDCSGFRALLIGDALGEEYEDWSKWLPVDRAFAVPTTNIMSPVPFTRSTAHEAGWQWRIPLQHRTGNGHVYSSKFIPDDVAQQILMSNLEGEPLAAPKQLRFTTGRRKNSWSHNVVALGLSGGFLEPLESTSIHLIQNGIARLFALFPDKGFNPIEREEYNKGMSELYEDIRDFIILHYHATQREDSEFWRYVKNMSIPTSLERKMDLFKSRGRVFRENAELFGLPSWVAVMLGQNIWPYGWDTLADALDEGRVRDAMRQMRDVYAATAQALPTHEEFIKMSGAWAADDERMLK